MAKHRKKEYEIRTIDEFGDSIDIIDCFPNTKKGRADAEAAMTQYLDPENGAVAVVLELVTHISDDDHGWIPEEHLANDDLDYSPVLVSIGDKNALREGGWVK